VSKELELSQERRFHYKLRRFNDFDSRTRIMDDSANPPRTNRSLAVAMVALAAVPFCLAVVAQLRPAAVAPIALAAPRPPLAFDQYAVNFREVPAREVIDARFPFTNRSDQPVRVTKLIPSCGCLAPKLYGDKHDYSPGERGHFTIGVKTAREQPGPKEYTTRIQYEAGGKAYEETLVLRLVLPEQKITVEPPEVFFYQLDQLTGQADSRTIHIIDKRGGNLEVLKVESNSPLAKASVEKMEIDADGRRRFPIRIEVPGEVPAGRHKQYLSIHTNDEEFPTVHVGVLVQGPESNVVPVSAEAVRPRPKLIGPEK
jgi:hypothetical protein